MILRKGKENPTDHKHPVPPPEDQCIHLIEQAKNGDNDAFGQLMEIYEKFVYHTACRILSTSGFGISEAEDIAQAAFLKAWRFLSAFRGDCSFSTWLYRITSNAAKDHIRAQIRHSTVPLHYEEGDDGDECEIDVPVTEGMEIPEDALDKKEAILAVRQAIEELPEDQRKVIILRDINELPYHAIAEMLGVEIGTVKSRINRGRQALKQLLTDKKIF